MALVINDRVKETSTTTGTGTYNLAGAVTGFQGFVAGIGTTNTTWYAATDGTDWEVGIGTVTDAAPDTLSRDTILESSNGDAAVSWGAGTRTIVCTLPSDKTYIGPVAWNGDNRILASDGTADGRTVQDRPASISDNGLMQIFGTDATYYMYRAGADANSARQHFIKNRHASDPFAFTVVQDGDLLGAIQASGMDGDQEIAAASITFVVDGAPANNDMPGRIVLSTTADGASSATEHLRITNSGRMVHTLGQVAHFWVYWTANSTTILASHNMDSIADTAVGDADGTITVDFSSANWCGHVDTNDSTANGWDTNSIQSSGFNARAVGTFGVLCGIMIDGGTAVGNLIDPQQWQASGFGVSA